MQGPRGEAHAVGNDIVTHPWLFTWLPLKAANQPRSAPQLAQVSSDHDNKVGPLALGRTARPNKNQTAAATVDGGAARCSSSNCVKFLHEVSEARASAMLVFSSADSSSEAVEAAVSSYLALLSALAPQSSAAAAAAAAEHANQQPLQQDQQQQQQLEQVHLPDSIQQEQNLRMPAAAAAPAAAAGVNTANRAHLLRRSLAFQWTDTILPSSSNSSSSTWLGRSQSQQQQQQQSHSSSSSTVVCSDVLHEFANILLCTATWHMVKAAATILTGQTSGQTYAQSSGTSSTAAMQAYKHYRTAAGQLEYIQQQLLPQLVGWLGNDLQPLLLSALQHMALAEAQSLSLQRALAKSHQPNLVAGIAADTAALYMSAYNNLTAAAAAAASGQQQHQPGTVGSSSSTAALSAADLDSIISSKVNYIGANSKNRHLVKLTCYFRYNACYCCTVAALQSAEAALADDKGGLAVAWSQEAARLVKHCYKLGVDFDRTDPPTPRGTRQVSEQALDNKTQATLAKCLKDNNVVYMQAVPKQLSLPEGKRVADPLPIMLPAAAPLDSATAAAIVAAVSGKSAAPAAAAAMSLPETAVVHSSRDAMLDHELDLAAVAAAATDGTSGSGTKQPQKLTIGDKPVSNGDTTSAAHSSGNSGGCSCWKACLLAICYPLLLIVSLVGVVIWLLLLPFKLCCCCMPCACAAQLAWNVVEYLIKAPLQGCVWAANKPSNSSNGGHSSRATEKNDVESQ